MLKNPVLKGFNPDPSAVVVDGTIYIATSSFLWMPGIRIYETRDLVTYKHTTDVLKNIDMSGHPLDCGIWAPQLSHVDGIFYLVYTIVSSTKRPFKDQKNFLITSKSIKGPWSKPTYLNGSGFDPSFFHEGDKTYLLNTLWDYRLKTPNKSAGIVIQRFDREAKELVGDIHHIFEGTEAKKTEASHIYKFDEYYYLITAEGGTGLEHQVTVARSKNVFGPYEISEHSVLMSTKDNLDYELQCTGHGSIIKFNNKLYMYYLTVRNNENISILGRETGLTEIFMNDDKWLRLKSDNKTPKLCLEDFKVQREQKMFTQAFNKPLKSVWNTIRTHKSNTWLKRNEEGLILKSGESIQSMFNLHLLGYRQTSHDFSATLNFIFNPTHFNQQAGLGLYLNEENYVLFFITHDKEKALIAKLHYKIKGESFLCDHDMHVSGDIHLQNISVKNNTAMFSVNNKVYPETLNVDFLSGGFTGNFITISVHDLSIFKGASALLNNFTYQVL